MALNLAYLSTRDALIKISRFFIELIAWSLLVSRKSTIPQIGRIRTYTHYNRLIYSVLILLFSWLLDFIWITLHLFQKESHINTDLTNLNKWLALFMVIWLFAAFICVTVLADVGVWKGAAAFTFFTMCIWGLDWFMCARKE